MRMHAWGSRRRGFKSRRPDGFSNVCRIRIGRFVVPVGTTTASDHSQLTVPAGTVWQLKSLNAALYDAAHLPVGKFARPSASSTSPFREASESPRVVSYHDARNAAAADGQQRRHERLDVRGAQHPGRFVGQDELPVADDRAGNRDPLPLPLDSWSGK
jgi:hypothetical protein